MLNKCIFCFISIGFFLNSNLQSAYLDRNKEIREAIYHGDVDWISKNIQEILYCSSLENIKPIVLNMKKALYIIKGIPFKSALWQEIEIALGADVVDMIILTKLFEHNISQNLLPHLRNVISIACNYAKRDSLSVEYQEAWFKSYIAERIARNNDIIELFKLS